VPLNSDRFAHTRTPPCLRSRRGLGNSIECVFDRRNWGLRFGNTSWRERFLLSRQLFAKPAMAPSRFLKPRNYTAAGNKPSRLSLNDETEIVMTAYPVEFQRRCQQKWEGRAAPGLYESARRMPWLLAIGHAPGGAGWPRALGNVYTSANITWLSGIEPRVLGVSS